MKEHFVDPFFVPSKQATHEKGYPHPGSFIEIFLNPGDECDDRRAVEIHFQYGHPQEVGRNGIFIDQVIDALADHLSVFQEPGHPMRSRETAVAITKLQEASMWIRERKRNRDRRGVLNTDKA